MKHLLLFSLLSFFFLTSNGQNPADDVLRTKHWCFGFDTGLNTVDAPRLEFTPSGPTVFTDAHSLGAEGHSSTSTLFGELLAYGGHGMGAWYDGQNDTISGTENEIGITDRIQGSLVLPVSNGASDQYYLFRMETDGPIDEIDLNYDFIEVGQGSTGLFVSQGNNDIPMLAGVTEALCSVHKCNGQGFWMLVHKYESNQFLIYSLDSTGVELHSSVNFGESVNQVQCVAKFSNNGSKVAFAAGRITVDGNLTPRLYLFDFDKREGNLSNPLEIQCPSRVNGMSFSPSNELLYLSTGTGRLVQYDLAVWDSLAIDTSLTMIWNNLTQVPFYLQLALDGKIYGAQGGAPQHTHIARIENPDVKGLGCNYVHNAVYLNGSASGSGLPNFPESYFNSDPTAYPCIENSTTHRDNQTTLVYPNPTADQLKIKSNDGIKLIEVFDQTGKLVLTRKVRNHSQHLQLNLDHLTNGLYLVSVQTRNNTFKSLVTKI